MTVFSALIAKERSSLKVVSIGKRRRISSAFTSAREGSSITTTVSRSSHHQLRVLLLSFTSSLFLLLSFIGPCGSFQFFHIDTSSHKHINMSAMKSLLAFNTKMRPRGYTSPLMLKSSSLKLNHLSTMRDNSRNLQTTKMMMMTTSSFNTDRTALLQTPLGTDSASHLLHGLDVYTIYSNDGLKHPMSLYGIHSDTDSQDSRHRRPVLLLHGRTWSSVPVYHLLGGKQHTDEDCNGHHKSRSLMESLYEQGLQPYALDFRGFGGTPSDKSHTVTPNTCLCDVECALDFITKKHTTNSHDDNEVGQQHLPVLLGWSQGALVAQLFAQKHPELISKLILYGSIYDPLVSYPPIPLYVDGTESSSRQEVKNTFNAAIEDFTIEGSIPPEPATKFAEAALISDPIKAQWTNLSQFNNVDPARISIPTLVVAGDQDPYAPTRVQASLFENLGRGADRTWSIIADADHAVHLLDDGRDRFVNIVTSFVENSKKGEKLF